ncbi:MAG: polysaccharide biosynthesis protein [Planctomycetes bacterium]|nr:polysaccharide biosynthesis protein [Planctomycetota bacterium]
MAALLVTFVVPVVLVRVLSTAEYGQYAQIILLHGFFFRVLQFGLRQSLFYYLPTEKESRGYYVTNTFICFMAAGLIFFVILTVFRDNLAYLFSADELAMLLPLCGLHTLFMLVSSPFESILIIDTKAERASVVIFASEVMRGVIITSFVLTYRTLFSAVVGLVCYSFIRCIAYSFYVHKQFGIKVDRDSLKHLKQQLDYAVPIGLSGIVGNTAKRLDKLILAAFFTPEIYAVYAVGNFRAPLIKTFFTSVSEVVLPRTVKMLKDGKVDQFVEFWKKLLVRLFFVGCGAFFTLQLVAHDLITLVFTSKFEASVPVFRILLFLILGEMFRYGIILRTIGDTKAILKSNLLSFVVSIPLAFILIPQFGLIGAALAALSVNSINIISQLTYSVIGLKKKVSDVFPVVTLFQLLGIGAALFLILWMVQQLIPYRVARLVFSGTSFAFFYSVICGRAQIFNLFEEKLVRRVLVKLNFSRA